MKLTEEAMCFLEDHIPELAAAAISSGAASDLLTRLAARSK